MLYRPSSVADTDLDIARAAYFGGEFAVYMTQTPAINLGQIDLTAAGAGTFTANPGAAIKAAGSDLQVVPITPVLSAAEVVLILAGTDNSSAPQNGTASFDIPSRAGNQTHNLARGYAVDVVAGGKFKTLTGLAVASSSVTPVTGGGANQSFRVYQLPELVDYELVEASMEIDFNTKDRVAKGIDSRMESDFWVKRGKAQPGELTIGSKFRSFVEGMARYSGQKCTVMLVGLKEGQVTTDRLVFTQYVETVKPKLPEGDGEATMEATGKFVDHLFFIAP